MTVPLPFLSSLLLPSTAVAMPASLPLRTGLIGLLLVGLLLLALGGMAPLLVCAQPSDVRLTAERRPVEVGMEPAFFHLQEEGNTLEQWSSHLWLSAPLGRRTHLWARAQMATASATGRASLDGVGDTRVGVSTVRSPGAGSLVGSLQVNIPSGRQSARSDQLETTVLLGQPAFEASVASLGQGWSVVPGLTWALPLGDRVVAGLGGSFRYLGGYVPLEDGGPTYTPGNEILLNAGLDVRLRPATAWSLDVAYTRYGTDEFGGVETFAPGDRWTVTTQIRTSLGRQADVRILGRYTGPGQGTLPPPPGGAGGDRSLQALPESLQGQVDGRFPLGRTVRMVVQARVARYASTDATLRTAPPSDWDLGSRRTLTQVGGGPEIRIGDAVSWRPHVTYTGGTFRRITARFALIWRQ